MFFENYFKNEQKERKTCNKEKTPEEIYYMLIYEDIHIYMYILTCICTYLHLYVYKRGPMYVIANNEEHKDFSIQCNKLLICF